MFVSTAIKARTPVALRGQTSRANGYSIKLNTPDGPKTITADGEKSILESAEVRECLMKRHAAARSGRVLTTRAWLLSTAPHMRY